MVPKVQVPLLATHHCPQVLIFLDTFLPRVASSTFTALTYISLKFLGSKSPLRHFVVPQLIFRSRIEFSLLPSIEIIHPSIMTEEIVGPDFCRQGETTHAPLPTYDTYLRTPPHPEYPSTHSVNAGAWAAIVSRSLGVPMTQKIAPFTVATEGYLLPTRTYTSIQDPSVEIYLSRYESNRIARPSVPPAV